MTGFGMFMGPGDIRTRHAIESTLETWPGATPITVKKHLKMTCFTGFGTLLKPYKMVVNLICTDRGGVKP